jgi:hypothetical protein
VTSVFNNIAESSFANRREFFSKILKNKQEKAKKQTRMHFCVQVRTKFSRLACMYQCLLTLVLLRLREIFLLKIYPGFAKKTKAIVFGRSHDSKNTFIGT